MQFYAHFLEYEKIGRLPQPRITRKYGTETTGISRSNGLSLSKPCSSPVLEERRAKDLNNFSQEERLSASKAAVIPDPKRSLNIGKVHQTYARETSLQTDLILRFQL